MRLPLSRPPKSSDLQGLNLSMLTVSGSDSNLESYCTSYSASLLSHSFREKELAKVVIKKTDVDLIVSTNIQCSILESSQSDRTFQISIPLGYQMLGVDVTSLIPSSNCYTYFCFTCPRHAVFLFSWNHQWVSLTRVIFPTAQKKNTKKNNKTTKMGQLLLNQFSAFVFNMFRTDWEFD